MSGVEKLAHEIKKRNNPKKIGQQVGKVTEVNPLKVSLCDGAIVLDDEITAICQAATFMKIGDEVLCEPMEDEQSWVIIDRIRTHYGPMVGTVKNLSPLKITAEEVTIKAQDIEATCKAVSTIELNDRILCLPIEGEDKWILVDKVV